MSKRKTPHKRWQVIAWDNDSGQHLTDRKVFARQAEDAGDAVCFWLEQEGFDLEVRLDIYELDD